jgi:ABC-type antimicrobial peptide transport system permease subunit
VIILFQYALKEMRKRRSKYALNVGAIILLVILLITLNSLSLAYKDVAGLPFKSINSTIIVQRNGNVPENMTGVVLSCSSAPIGADYLSKVKGVDGVKDVSYGLLLWVFDHDNFKRVFGVNWNDGFGRGIVSEISVGSAPQTSSEVLVDKAYADHYDLGVNRQVSVSGVDFRISGIIESSGKNVIPSDVYVPLTSAQTLAYNSRNLQATERFSETDVNVVFVDVDQVNLKQVSQKLNNILSVGQSTGGNTPTGQVIGSYSIYTPTSFENQISSVFKLSDQLTLILSLIVPIGAILIIANSSSHTLLERRREFGIMKAVGFRNRDIQQVVFSETLLQVLIGYVAGLILSFIVIALLARTTVSVNVPWEVGGYPHFLLPNPNLAGTVLTYLLPISFQVTYALLSGAIVVAIGLLTTMILARRINGLKAMEVLRYE